MTNIFDVYNFSRNLTDKAGKGFLPPDEFGGWLAASQIDLFNAGRAIGMLDNRTQDMLAPFVAPAFAFTSSASGQFVKPADYVQALRVVNSTGKEYTPILFNELRDALRSTLDPIAENPRYGEAGNYIALYPQIATTGTLTYYRLPVTPVIGYTEPTPGNYVYDPTTSVQLEIPPAYWYDVIRRALVYVGINLGDADLFALSQSDKG